MRFHEVFRYELEHHQRSASTWIYAAILFGIAFVVIHGQAEDVGAVRANAPVSLAVYAVSVGMFGVLITAALFGEAAVRDVETGMAPLLYTSPLRKAEYLAGRFLATLLVNAVVLFAIPLGLAAGTVMPYLDPAAFGPFRAAAFLQPWLLFLLPNLVLAGAVLFTVGVLARQVIPVYLAAIGLILSFLTAAQSLSRFDDPVLAVLGDPLGLLVLMPMAEGWTAAEQNARLIGVPATLMWNRVVWMTIATAILAVLHRTFRFAHHDGGGRRENERVIVETESKRTGPVAIPRIDASFGLGTRARQTLAIARNSVADVVANRWFVVVLLACMSLAVLFGWDNMADNPFDTSTWPVTILVAEALLDSPIIAINFLLIAVYAGELVWKEREVGTAEIADATPVPEGAQLLGRFLALVAMVVMLQAAIIAGSIVFQALEGYYHFELGLYLSILGLNLADLVLLAALAMTIHVVVNHKYVGHILVLIACVFPFVAEESGILRHHLLLYARDPGWTYSDMNGFGPFLGPFVWFKLYWAAWALLLGVVTCVLWVRGRESGMRRRLGQVRARFTGPVVRTAAVAIGLILVLGGFIFYNTNMLNEYDTRDEQGGARAEYEQRYGRFEDAPQPTIESAGLRVEIQPAEQAVDLHGSYRLVNRTEAPIDSVHVFVSPDMDTRTISFDRVAKAVLTDERFGYRIYALARALNPGESMQLSFDVAFRRRGFPNSGIQTDMVGNGAYFGRTWLPFIGYQPAFELSDDETRERYGLEPRPPLPGPDAVAARRYRYEYRNEDRVRVATIVGTSSDQIAITSGVLRRAWTHNGRRWFHYEMEAPQSFGAIVFSGRYAMHEDRWNDVALRVFHHPDHDYNVDTFVRSMKASLEYYTAQFGPYQGSQLSVVEIPRYGRFGRAHANTIAFTEDNFYMRVKDGELDALFFGTAHETAHQWWGGQIKGAFGVRGSQAFLSESLSNYSALMVTEKAYGVEAARRIYGFQMDRYLTMRARASRDVPLLQVENQAWIYYGKGAVAMYLIRDYIGDDAVSTALRRFIEKHRAGIPPYPTALDVYAELQAVTPDSLKYLLTDLFETVTLWDVSTKRAAVERNGAGEYVLTLDVVAKKLRADSVGNQTDMPMDDFVEIGVFAPGEGDALGEPLYLQRHRIRDGEQTLRITVPRQPARAGIDPFRKLIDREGGNNVVEVEAARGTSGRARLP